MRTVTKSLSILKWFDFCLVSLLTLWTSNYFCKTPVGARLIFSMLLLGAELIFAKLPHGAGLFFESEKRRDPRELSCLQLNKY